jgi:hypothetical protein
MRKLSPPQILFIFTLVLGTALNVFTLIKETFQNARIRRQTPSLPFGAPFAGLREILTGETYVGYYTDKSLDTPADARDFAQAQYAVVPLILDFNHTHHTFTIFNCSTTKESFRKIKELGLTPLKINPFGIILAQNPQRKP